MSSLILRVALPTPLRKLFDYLPPIENEIGPFEIGSRILVPFRSHKKIGIIIGVSQKTNCPIEKLKRAYAILDPKTLFPKTLLDLIHWASQYYQTSLGEVFETALPSRLRKETGLLTKQKSKTPKKISKQEENASEAFQSGSTPETPLILNTSQQNAVDILQQKCGQFKTFLLDGVTGSGKTEVYIKVIKHVLSLGKQALVLVPEIGLTPQLLSRFQKHFKEPIACLNSSLTEKQRFEAWESARIGATPIVIGTRSATFVPLKSPGIFIVDEEHDASFKQQEGFRYHARDLIIMRGSLEQCPVVLGSATPSMESLNNIYAGRYHHLKLPLRAGKANLPVLQILDIRHKKLQEGLSAQLMAKMREHIADKGQVLLFLNRRGFAPVLMCFDCGWVANCQLCDARMTMHQRSKKLQCHHCESVTSIPEDCPTCNSKGLKPIGIGTERLEAALQENFPECSIIRIDRDTTRKKGAMQETLQKIHSGKAEILLGTQMIAKGHHFPNVTLVAILDIDNALFSIDFRSLERMGQLITQVAGRAGRADRLGHVMLQTCHPKHALLKKLLDEGYSSFASSLLAERQAVELPPYSYQALIRAEGNKLEYALNFLNLIKSEISKQELSDFKILGPISAPMERRLGKYRAQLLLQAKKRSLLQKCLQNLVNKIETDLSPNNVRWSLDIDPLDMY